jgi:cobalamin-dependent methionine synthase I
MGKDRNLGADFISVGENIHTTRILRRKGKSVVEHEGRESISYAGPENDTRFLVIPETFKERQEYRQGQIKHVMIAVYTAMSGEEHSGEAMTYLAMLARKQVKGMATYLDVNVDEISYKLDDQKKAMRWLVEMLQQITTSPLSIDSSNAAVIEVGLAAYNHDMPKPLLNSASLERLDALDLALEHNASVVVTAAGASGMPDGTEGRVDNASKMVESALSKGFNLNDIFIDPLVFPASVDKDFGFHALDAVSQLRTKFGPEIHITGGISNVSFGIPGRRLVNEVFMILMVEAGADGGIIDPVLSNPNRVFSMDKKSESYRMAEDVILGRDEFCQNYIAAWRGGKLDVGQ